MKITDDVRRFAAEQGIKDADALDQGLEQKAREFAAKGSDIYIK